MGKDKRGYRIAEDDEDAPLANKRPRIAEPASQPQPPVVAEEEEEGFIIEDGLKGFEEEEVDKDYEHEKPAKEGEEYAVEEPGSEGGNRQEQMRSTSTAPPVFSNENRSLQAVFTDPDVLDCPICFDPLVTPVFQCENGHIACSSCCSKVKKTCPSCCIPIGYIRNLAVEKILESVKISCRYTHNGCKRTVLYSEKIEHEKTCPYITCFCPHPSCLFFGFSNNLYLHFGIQHAASITRFTYNTTLTLPIEKNQKHIFLQTEQDGVIFILNQEVKEHGRAFNVDCVGSSILIRFYKYQLTAKNMWASLSLKSRPEMHAKWSEHTPKKNCLTVPPEFPGYNGVLSLDVRIKKIPS